MKIMIADDEVIIRTGLAQVIGWQEIGLTLLSPAESAEEALERLETERPDILLTDIRMNGKSGLQLAEEARASLPDLEVIILSGYDDFHYAQQALRQQIGDYLLKTSRPEDIIRAVLKAKRRVEERKASRSREEVRKREDELRGLVRWIAEGETADPALAVIRQRLEGLAGGSSELAGWQVLLIEADGWGESMPERSLLRFAADNMVRDVLGCVSFVLAPWVVAALPVRKQELAAGVGRWHAAFEQIEHLLKCKLTVVGGSCVDDPAALHASWLAAKEAHRYKPLLAVRRWQYDAVCGRKGGKAICTGEEELELGAVLLEDDPIVLKAWVHRYVQTLLDDSQVTPDSLASALQSAENAAQRWLERVLAATGRSPAPARTLAQVKEEPGETAEDGLFQHLLAVMKLYHHRLAEGKKTHVRKAIAYLEERWGQEVSLQQVAEHVHLHPNHLGDLFKREMGMRYTDYVAQRKMQRAAELLSTSPAKVSEVAAMVGYYDVKYFSQTFKKHTGKTPSEYRASPT